MNGDARKPIDWGNVEHVESTVRAALSGATAAIIIVLGLPGLGALLNEFAMSRAIGFILMIALPAVAFARLKDVIFAPRRTQFDKRTVWENIGNIAIGAMCLCALQGAGMWIEWLRS